MKLSPSDQHREEILLKFCENNQGAAISNLNSLIAPGATTYRDEFCDAAADLIRLYSIAGVKSPVLRMALMFSERGIKSCRGNSMTPTVVGYFYKRHLAKRLKGNGFIVLDKILKKECPFCGKRKINLQEHIQAVHSE